MESEIKSVEIISREQLESAGVVILHLKSDTFPGEAVQARDNFSARLAEAGYEVPVIAVNCFARIEVQAPAGCDPRSVQYGLKNSGGWIMNGDGLPFRGTYGEVQASLESLRENPAYENLKDAVVCKLPQEGKE